MSQLTDTGENSVLDNWLASNGTHLGLFTADPTETGSLAAEVSGGSYARQSITWGAAAGGVKSNSADCDFGTATAPWGVVSHWGICTALTAGSMLVYGALDSTADVQTNDTFKITAGNLSITAA